MNLRKFVVCLSFVLFCFSQSAFAGKAGPSPSIQTMATVINYLNHYPEGAEKAKLQKIMKDSSATAHEKTIANALIKMQHSVSAGDKKKLSKIMSDSSASQGAKDLAGIVSGLNHKASASDKAILKKYMW